MKRIIKDVLYYNYNSNKEISDQIILKKTDVIVTESITSDFLKKIAANNYKVIFIGNENIFSHSMNVLRKVIGKKDTVIVVGVICILDEIRNSTKINLFLKDNKIVLDGNEYLFQRFNFAVDTDEEIEYNIVSRKICYKPDYYYNLELAEIIREGFDDSKIKTKQYSHTIISNDIRIWNYGIGFPRDIFQKIQTDLSSYYKLLLEYLDVLHNITMFYHCNYKNEKLVCLLIKHFSYSTLFSFDLTRVSAKLFEELKEEKNFEQYYKCFSFISPIADKKALTEKEIKRAKKCLLFLLCGQNEKFLELYPEFEGLAITDTVILFFVMHLFSDIRRCVIGMLIENNDWFASICTHKKRKSEVY